MFLLQELESLNLQDQVNSLLKQLENNNVPSDEQLSSLELQNTKLKHRLSILKNVSIVSRLFGLSDEILPNIESFIFERNHAQDHKFYRR